jgi:hypothetical protein
MFEKHKAQHVGSLIAETAVKSKGVVHLASSYIERILLLNWQLKHTTIVSTHIKTDY